MGHDRPPRHRLGVGAGRGDLPRLLLTLGLDRLRLGARIGAVLVAMGAIAAFAMGANDVSNASGALVGTGTFSPLEAGAVGGAAIAVGVLTWGKPLLRRVAFEIVEVDRAMATAAQLVQAAVVLAAVAFGFFSSMNQALVGAMAGAGFARGRETVHLATLYSILQGWVLGPAGSIAAGYVFGLARPLIETRAVTGHGTRFAASVLAWRRGGDTMGTGGARRGADRPAAGGRQRFASKVQLLETAERRAARPLLLLDRRRRRGAGR